MKKSQIIFVSSFVVLACFVLLTQFSPTLEQSKEDSKSLTKGFVPKLKKVDPALILANKRKLENSHYTPKEQEFITANLSAKVIADSNPYALLNKATMAKASSEGYGSLEELKFDSPQAKKLKEALVNPAKYPERLSTQIAPKPFDWERFKNDRQYKKEYLQSAEPARAKTHGKASYPRFKRLSPFYMRLEQGKSITLKYQGVPYSPYTITSYDAGLFSNGLSTQTKVADGNGYVNFVFRATSGLIAEVNISCSGPRSSNTLRSIIDVVFNSAG